MDLFKKYNLKRTKTREIIVAALEEIKRPISAENLYVFLSKDYNINLATIYRNLNTLADLKFINKVIRQDSIAYYSLKNIHSHFMVCDKCDKEIELDHCPIDQKYIESLEKNNFLATGHIFEIHGLCSECQKNVSKDGE